VRAPRISVPIVLTVAVVTIAIALTVAWQILVVWQDEQLSALHWSLVIVGSLFFAVIITTAILQAVWLVGEIRNNQRQRNFIDAVTHELHTPLASLQLYLETLRDQELEPAARVEFLSIMGDELARLRRTIDQILSAARTEVRRGRQAFDLTGLLRECVLDTIERHNLAPGAIRLALPGRARVRGDADQLRLAFKNLLDNAVRYGGDALDVELVLRALPGRKLEVAVADRGLGIAPSALGRLFQRFQRLSAEGRAPRGLGLGLFMVRNIVRAHGGSVRAESEGQGQGSRFLVTLPGQLDEAPHPAG
jgi:signal transduction histidine kinase